MINIKSLISELGSADPVGDTLWGDFTGERNYFGVYGKLGETKGSFALLAAMHRLKLAGVNVGLVALAHGKPDVEAKISADGARARPYRSNSATSISSALARARVPPRLPGGVLP